MNNNIIQNITYTPQYLNNMQNNQSRQRQNVVSIINLQAPHIENYYRGIRESCEDIVCSKCNSYADNQNWGQFKQCKQQCFSENKEAINTCCKNMCGNNSMCNESCIELNYGNIPNNFINSSLL
jgi:hypothetical protein